MSQLMAQYMVHSVYCISYVRVGNTINYNVKKWNLTQSFDKSPYTNPPPPKKKKKKVKKKEKEKHK